MQEIPLFPLNVVLFPQMTVPLRIFEDRYKQMLAYCLEHNSPFGIVLIRSGRAEFGPTAEPYAIGCTAEIAEVQPLEDGQSFIMAHGQQRFRILALKRERPYLTGQIELMPFTPEPPTVITQSADRLRPQMWQYLDVLQKSGRYELDSPIPQNIEDESLGMAAAALLQVPVDIKQRLLEEPRLSRMMDMMTRLYIRENNLLRTMPQEEMEPFSMN